MLTMSSSAFLRASTFLALVMGMASCVPAPHLNYLRPAVKGIVLEDEKPIAGVELYLSKFPGTNQPCVELGDVVPVSADGSFSWTSVQERDLTDSLLNPVAVRARLTVLCIRHPTKGVLIGAMLFTKQNKPAALRLICDVGRPNGNHGIGPDTTSTFLGQSQYCETSQLD